MIGGNQSLQGVTITGTAATATLSGATAFLAATPKTETTFTADITGASDIRTRSVCSLIQESLSLWGFLCAKTAPDYAKARAITDLNTALQLVWSNADGHDYWTNETLTITLDDTEDSYALPDSIQNVKGPCRRNDTKQPLAAIGSISEFESFVDLYLDGDAAAGPVAYHIETMAQTGEDPAKTVFRITPAVSGTSVAFLLDVVKEAPRYTTSDLVTCPAVPIPHRYAETLLVPIIRYNASSYYLFEALDPKQKETIDREYQQARQTLGLSDPNPVKETPATKEA